MAACLGLAAFAAAQDQAAQDQQSQSGNTAASAPSADASAPDAATNSPTDPTGQSAAQADASADAQAAPQDPKPNFSWHYDPSSASQDGGPQGAPPAAANAPAPQATPPQNPAAQGMPPASVPAPSAALPQTLVVPAGTVIPVRLRQWLSSDQNHAGDTFDAELDGPIVVDGWVVARRGQSVLGRVVLAQKANHGNNESKLGLELSEITLVDGEQLTVSTELVQNSQTRSQGRDAATLGTTTALGAIIGAAVGGGQGAAIGAAAGIGAGMATVMSTPGRPTVLQPEQPLTFRLQSAVNINTVRGHVAFRPVTQADYGRAQEGFATRPVLRYPGPGAPYPPYGPYAPYAYAPYAPAPIAAYPAPYAYGYCGGPTLWSCYPGPLYFSLGLWGGWDFAPRGGFVGRPGFRR